MSVLGTAGPTEQRKRYGFDPVRGYYTVRTWRGRKTQMEAKILELQTNNIKYDVVESDGGYVTVEAQYADAQGGTGGSGEQSVTNTWELLPTEVSKDVLSADIVDVQQIQQTDREKIGDWQRSGIKPTGLTGNAKFLYEQMKDGLTSVEVFAPIIRHTQSVGPKYAGRANFTYCNRVLSLAALQSEGIPANIFFSVADFTYGFRKPESWSGGNILNYGWLKKWPTITSQGGNGLWQIQREWKYGLWSQLLYGFPI